MTDLADTPCPDCTNAASETPTDWLRVNGWAGIRFIAGVLAQVPGEVGRDLYRYARRRFT